MKRQFTIITKNGSKWLRPTDAESHGRHISDDYWRKRCEAAERFIAKSPCDNDITPAQEAAYDAWQEIVKEESK